jgi:hypothetical protein
MINLKNLERKLDDALSKEISGNLNIFYKREKTKNGECR